MQGRAQDRRNAPAEGLRDRDSVTSTRESVTDSPGRKGVQAAHRHDTFIDEEHISVMLSNVQVRTTSCTECEDDRVCRS
jgi:hypothetical protein